MQKQSNPKSGEEHPSSVKKRQYPPLRNCLNYAFVMQQLLAILNDPFCFHINLLNAILNCPCYSHDTERFIKETGTNYSVYLSNMLMDKRNAPSELIGFMKNGIPYQNTIILPNAETFQTIVEPEWSVNKGDEMAFRQSILDCLASSNDKMNWHLTKDMRNELRDLALDTDISFYKLVFECTRYTIIRKNNSFYRDIKTSEYLETVYKSERDVALLSTGFLTLYDHDHSED